MKKALAILCSKAILSVSLVFGNGGAQDSIVETATNAGVFNTLLAAATAAGLVEFIDNDVPKTVFAPTDDAFAALPAGTVDTLLLPENIDWLRDILQYHIVEGNVLAADLSTGFVETTSRAGLRVDVNGGVQLDQRVNVTTADIIAKNGVIHIIDGVLLPPTNNVLTGVLTDPELSTLAAAAAAVEGLPGILAGDRPITLFAPTDAAFAKLPAGTVESLLLPENAGALANILLYHAATTSIYSSDFANRPFAMANGGSIEVEVTDQYAIKFPGGQTTLKQGDIRWLNGVIHKIEDVLLPGDMDVVDMLIANGNYNTLVAAVQAADLVDTLRGLSGVTIFAPTDDAFAALPPGYVTELLTPEKRDELIAVLLYHVLPAQVFAQDISTQTFETALGNDLVTNVNGTVTINGGPTVTGVNMLASNGVIHSIDGVLLPPVDIATTLTNMGDFTTLLTAVVAADLAGTLSGPGNFTVFAPTDAAFAALPDGVLDSLLADVDALTNVLLYHVLGTKVRGGELLTGPVTTLQGGSHTVHFNGSHLQIGTTNIIISDVITSNGVIHVIDAVLVPPAS